VLPKVALKDLDGNEWPADRLAAKTTIAVVWATWCGPCLKELPSFAKLAEQLKDRRDVQVVSFNIDENPGLVKAFLDKTGYKFPVLPAKNFAEDLMPYLSIPRTWIIRDGAIVEETEGFGGDGDRWVERVAGQVK
jgi:thiol-disulfide isomerase/thioredoxin